MKNIKKLIFLPVLIILIPIIILNFTHKSLFESLVTNANNVLIANLGGIFSLYGLFAVLMCIAVYFSPLGEIKIGGKNAKPLLSKFNWWAITICTTVAAGLTFWGFVESITHYTQPPVSLGIIPNSPQAATFSLSTMFLHWSFTPYAIYCIPSLVFAFAYYNMKKPFTLSSTLTPIFGDKILGKRGYIIDIVCLISLVLGLAASFGTATLNLGSGLNYVFGFKNGPLLWGLIIIAAVVVFSISSSLGLMSGIQKLSAFNVYLFIGIIIFLLVVGPTSYIVNLGVESLGEFLTNFFQKSLFTGQASGDTWSQSWTTFYWANWLASAPITSMFLGRISYGHKIKDFILVNFLTPSIFGIIWMSIFGGIAINLESNGLNLSSMLGQTDLGLIIYTIFEQYPLAFIIVPFFIFLTFISFVTAADSNTNAMGAVVTNGIDPYKEPEAKNGIKVFWGLLVALISWIMISFAGIDGIKVLSNLGGLPALILGFLVLFVTVKLMISPELYNTVDNKPSKSSDKVC
ncbi:MAG: BCCT family transporter [Peptostreptococcaceae bacterium]